MLSRRQWLALIIGTYLLLKGIHLQHTIGDQGIYLYAAKLWSKGVIPYRDFFISHPPLHLLLPTLVILLTGLKFPLLNALPSLLGLFSGLLVERITRRAMGDIAGLFACALFLFSYAHLSGSAQLTGVNLTLLFLLFGMDLHYAGKPRAAGVALGASVLCGIYVLPGIAGLLFLDWRKGQKVFRELLGSFLGATFLLHLPFLIIAGMPFLEQVYLYHLAGTGGVQFFAPKSAVLSLVTQKNIVLVLLLLCAIPVHYRCQEQSRLVKDALIILGLYALFFLVTEKLFSHYLLLTLPFAVITVTFFFLRILEWGTAERTWINRAIVSVLLLGLIGHSTALYFQYSEKKHFARAEEIALYLKNTLQEDETLYGDFAVVPLLALLSDRHIAAREIDSSIQRFVSNKYDLTETISAIESDNVTAIVSRPHRGIVIYPPFKEYLRKNFMPTQTFEGVRPDTNVTVWLKRAK